MSQYIDDKKVEEVIIQEQQPEEVLLKPEPKKLFQISWIWLVLMPVVTLISSAYILMSGAPLPSSQPSEFLPRLAFIVPLYFSLYLSAVIIIMVLIIFTLFKTAFRNITTNLELTIFWIIWLSMTVFITNQYISGQVIKIIIHFIK